MKIHIDWTKTVKENTPTAVFLYSDQLAQITPLLSQEVIAKLENNIDKSLDLIEFDDSQEKWFFVVFPKTTKLENYRKKGHTLFNRITQLKEKSLQILNVLPNEEYVALLEGFILSSYSFNKYFTNKEEATFSNLYLVADEPNSQVNEMINVAASTMIARDFVNEPLSYLTAEQFSLDMRALGQKNGFEVTIWDKDKIEKEAMGGILAVNKGSFTPPTFNIIEYKHEDASDDQPIVFVGKGIVFDTGGLSLKPTPNSMDFMKADMGGAATVIGAINAIATNQLPLHIIGLIPCTDNRPGNNAYVPGDVVTMYSGSTVEVLNTDAEGRMVMADALHYAKRLNPSLVIDFATLTGAAAFTTAGKAICYMGSANKLTKKLFKKAGKKVHERLFEFPLWDDFGDMIKSDIADIKNVGGKGAGMITAGKFLEHFTDYEWLHFDIAGCGYLHAQDSYRSKGGTGVGVRLTYQFLKDYIKENNEA